jgi:hypothetical protein
MGLLPPANIRPRGVRLDADGDAWVDLPAAEVVEAAKVNGCPVIILARDVPAANAFRREHGLSRRQVVYATEASVRGYTDCEIVVLPRWHERRDAERIWAAMLPMLLCNRPPRAED